jgi:hypothetical protein
MASFRVAVRPAGDCAGEFVVGLSATIHGSIETKMQFLFKAFGA